MPFCFSPQLMSVSRSYSSVNNPLATNSKKNQSYEVDASQTPCSLTTAVNHSRLHLFRKYFLRGMVLSSMVDTVMRQLLLAARLRGSAMDSDQRALKHRVMFPVTTPRLS